MQKKNVLIKLSPEAHCELIAAGRAIGLTPTAMARLLVLKGLVASFTALDEVRS